MQGIGGRGRRRGKSLQPRGSGIIVSMQEGEVRTEGTEDIQLKYNKQLVCDRDIRLMHDVKLVVM